MYKALVLLAVVAAFLAFGCAGAQPASPQGELPAEQQMVPNIMSADSCASVGGTVMDINGNTVCTEGTYPVAEVQSSGGAKKFCCKKIDIPLPDLTNVPKSGST